MSKRDRDPAVSAFPQRLERYFGDDAKKKGVNFAIEIFVALKKLLRRYGGEAFFIYEPAVAEVGRRLSSLYGANLKMAAAPPDGDQKDRAETIARAAAAIAVEIALARPIKEFAPMADSKDQPRNLLLAPNAYCALVIGLAIAMMTLDETQDADVVVGSADLAVDAAFAELHGALRARDAVTALTQQFLSLSLFRL